MNWKNAATFGAICIGTVAVFVIAERTAPGYHDVGPEAQKPFKRGGKRGHEPARGDTEADRLFKSSVPLLARIFRVVEAFVDEKEISHVKSRKNAPDKADAIDNLILEGIHSNRTRGARDMTREEKTRIEMKNQVEAVRLGFMKVMKR